MKDILKVTIWVCKLDVFFYFLQSLILPYTTYIYNKVATSKLTVLSSFLMHSNGEKEEKFCMMIIQNGTIIFFLPAVKEIDKWILN